MFNFKLFIVLVTILASNCGIFSQYKDTTALPFPNENISIQGFGGMNLQNKSDKEFLISGVIAKLRQETENHRVFWGASATFLKGSYKDENTFIYDTRYGGGFSLSSGRKTGWLDLDIQFQHIEREGEVRHSKISWTEDINVLDACLIVDWRKRFTGKFEIARTKLYLEYIYPLSGEKQLFDDGVAMGDPEAASNMKSIYGRLELTWFNKRMSSAWAFTSFFLVGYDHQSWNKSDNYSAGVGVRFYRKDLEVLTLNFEEHFKGGGVGKGEPRVFGTLNMMPVVNWIF